jgi:hypothetical protein
MVNIRLATLAIIVVFFLPFTSCKDSFDINDPDVDKFVELVKAGKYQEHQDYGYELPSFTFSQLEDLFKYVDDVSEVSYYPTNPISSAYTMPKYLSECILWTIEGIRMEVRYVSLQPHMLKVEEEEFTRLTPQEILEVAAIYKSWWADYKSAPSETLKQKDLLEDTPYMW